MPTAADYLIALLEPFNSPRATFLYQTHEVNKARRVVDLIIDAVAVATLFTAPPLSKDVIEKFKFMSSGLRTTHSFSQLLDKGYSIKTLHLQLMNALTVYAFAAEHLIPQLAGKINSFLVQQIRAAASHTGSKNLIESSAKLTSYKLSQIATAALIGYFFVETVYAVYACIKLNHSKTNVVIRSQLNVIDPALQLLRRVGRFTPSTQLTLNLLSSYIQIL